MPFLLRLALAVAVALPPLAAAKAQTTPRPGGSGPSTVRPPQPVEPGKGILYLSATFGVGVQPVRTGLVWRVFQERAEADGSHALVAELREPSPALALPDGEYIVHVAYGLAGVNKRVVVAGRPVTERLAINAGGLKISGVLGEAPIAPGKLKISIFIPERGNSEAKLVVADARADEVQRLPEGLYHIVSTYLDTVSPATQPKETANVAALPTNSIVAADLRVPAGKLIEATLRHKAATMTLKLVNAPGGEALANTTFTVLTPGGDVIRELIGAFPALVLAEGEYVAIARHENQTYQTTFRVQSALDRDVEVVAK